MFSVLYCSLDSHTYISDCLILFFHFLSPSISCFFSRIRSSSLLNYFFLWKPFHPMHLIIIDFLWTFSGSNVTSSRCKHQNSTQYSRSEQTMALETGIIIFSVLFFSPFLTIWNICIFGLLPCTELMFLWNYLSVTIPNFHFWVVTGSSELITLFIQPRTLLPTYVISHSSTLNFLCRFVTQSHSLNAHLQFYAFSPHTSYIELMCILSKLFHVTAKTFFQTVVEFVKKNQCPAEFHW